MPIFVRLMDYKNRPVHVNVNAIRTLREFEDEDFRCTSVEMPENVIAVQGSPEDVLAVIAEARGR